MSLNRWRKHLLPQVVVIVWVFGAGAGMRALVNYSYAEGSPATSPSAWPGGRGISSSDRSKLVLFMHSQCPCSRATVQELSIIMARCRGRVDAYAYFYSPRSVSGGWKTSALWRDASVIPGVKILADEDGRESRRFGASTSGQVLLYDGVGRLRFKGGITISRGHAGSNSGRDAIVDILEGRKSGQDTAPVFGCSLSGTGR